MFNKFLGEYDKNRIVVVGDVHGDLNQLIYPLVYFMKNFDKCKKIIYLGDFIDRGESNVYIYEILKKLILLNNLVLFISSVLKLKLEWFCMMKIWIGHMFN